MKNKTLVGSSKEKKVEKLGTLKRFDLVKASVRDDLGF